SPYNIQHPARQFLGHYGRLKVAYAPTPDQRFSLTFNTEMTGIDNNGGGNKNSYLGVAEDRQNQHAIITVLAWDWLRWQRVQPTLQVGFLRSGLDVGPQGRLGKVDFTGCDKFSPANCVYERDRPEDVNNTANPF